MPRISGLYRDQVSASTTAIAHRLGWMEGQIREFEDLAGSDAFTEAENSPSSSPKS